MTVSEAIMNRLNEKHAKVEQQSAKVRGLLLNADMEVLAEIDDLKTATEELATEAEKAWQLQMGLERFGVKDA
jgi:hypothetical protein